MSENEGISMEIYFFPSCPREGYVNPYCDNYKRSLAKQFHVAELDNPVTKMKSLTLFKYSFRSDLFILNWIENAQNWTFGLLQFAIVLISLCVIKVRRKKIVWMLHNLKPHEGQSLFSEIIKKILLHNSSFILSHSIEAANTVRPLASCRVEYICHPVSLPSFEEYKNPDLPCDVLIWGSILPYKGIAEFLEYIKNKDFSKKILILGKCKDCSLEQRILSNLSPNIVFENRFVGFGEIAAYVKKAEFVLFPYIGESVSSSGVLMETIAMNGGFPVGPNKGAFKDLYSEGMCLTYDSYDELLSIMNEKIPRKDRNSFIESNSWEKFADKFFDLIDGMELL